MPMASGHVGGKPYLRVESRDFSLLARSRHWLTSTLPFAPRCSDAVSGTDRDMATHVCLTFPRCATFESGVTFVHCGLMLGIAVLATLIAAGTRNRADARSLAEVRQTGILRLCANPSALPYSNLSDRGGLTGFEVEVAEALAHEIGLELRVTWVRNAGKRSLDGRRRLRRKLRSGGTYRTAEETLRRQRCRPSGFISIFRSSA